MSADAVDGPAPAWGGPGMTRRGLIKTVGAGTAIAAVGAGSQSGAIPSPVGEARAIACGGVCIAGVAVGAAAGGYLVADWLSGGGDIDTEDVLEDEIYAVGNGVAEGRESFVNEIQTQFVDRSQDRTPFANAAWSEVRATTVNGVVNGDGTGEIQTAATQDVNLQESISIINMVERWNAFVDGMLEAMVLDTEEGVNNIQMDGGTWTLHPAPEGTTWVNGSPDTSPIDASEINGNGEYVVFEETVDLPAPLDDIEGRSEELTVLGIAASADGASDPSFIAPEFSGTGALGNIPVEVTHSSLETITIADATIYSDALSAIESEATNIRNSLSDYVSTMHDGITEGAIDPSRIIGPQDLIDQFGASDQVSRIAAELAAVGGEVSSDQTYQATISHPDLESDELDVWLWPQFGDQDPAPIKPGTTLASADYELAYVAYPSQVDDSIETRVLSGDSDLQIIDVQGVEGESSVDEEAHGSDTSTDGRLTIWTGEDPPEPIQFPADHSDWSIHVTGAESTSTHSPTEVQTDGDEYYLPTTGLNDGEAVESVRLVPPVEYEDSAAQYVADPTNVSPEDEVALIEQLSTTADELDEALGGGGGGLFGGAWPFGIVETIIIGVLGLLGLSFASS